MAHKKSAGSTKSGRDSFSKRLGVKITDGQKAYPGNIIVRQRGTKFRYGQNVKRSKDDTLIALKEGIVRFKKKYIRRGFDNKKKIATYVRVMAESKKS